MTEQKKVKFKRKRITALKRGQHSVFKSTGISEVKVTRLERIEGEEEAFEEILECLEIPIKSTGISELIDTFNTKAPVPPVVNKLIEPDSEIGKELGFTKKNAVKMFDLTDDAYLKSKEQHNSKLGIAIVMKGLDIDLLDENDQPITDDEEKIKMLKDMGFSSDQFSKLVKDITSLTQWSDAERERFLE